MTTPFSTEAAGSFDIKLRIKVTITFEEHKKTHKNSKIFLDMAFPPYFYYQRADKNCLNMTKIVSLTLKLHNTIEIIFLNIYSLQNLYTTQQFIINTDSF